ncbi:hypothetical protein HPB50_010441 [Hyalomma asiaticum]|uniref:Uncharacterized protein n=1 Tax=Hyalomma asiaticum TaxID=266040 RepID=A0ACB7T244_HYAAI|nr:hypothetical protein HPB50_010441 [Hyalomma asiaticum]
MTSTSTTDSTTMISSSTTDATPTVSSVDVEAQFAARRITSDLTKYHYVVSCLPPPIPSEIRDLSLDPPAEKAYATLRETLVRRVTPTESQRLQQLLRDTYLGDPSLFPLTSHLPRPCGREDRTLNDRVYRSTWQSACGSRLLNAKGPQPP